MIADIQSRHESAILAMNAAFVHWLSPMNAEELRRVLALAQYARQVGDGAGVLIGYAHDTDDPDHWNLAWLRKRLDNFFYIDRVIIAAEAHGQGYAQALYEDVARFARARGHTHLACEVNTIPDNPGSHRFHLRAGFNAIGERNFPDRGKAVRYYAKPLL